MKNFNRWSSFQFNGGVKAQNRIVVPPMASATATLLGFVTEDTLMHYRNLTQSGAGIVFVEYTYVHPSGRGEENQLGIYSDKQIHGLKKIAKVIQQAGALAGIQLVHNGAKASSKLTGGELLAPSPIAVPVRDLLLETPRELSLEEISSYQSWYCDAISRAAQAGFQLIELHAAHGYGLNQWLSPITNQRQDRYGGGIENRIRMLMEIIEAARKKYPQVVFGVRLPGTDYVEGGLTSAEMIWVAKELEIAGVDFLDISSGIGGWRRPSDRLGEGYLVPEAEVIQKNVQVPVIGVGGIFSGEFIDQALQQDRFQFAAVGRAILSDPRKFNERVLQGNLYE